VTRRVLGAVAGASLLTGALALSLVPQTARAASCGVPHVQAVTNALGHGGDLVTVTGSGFTCGGQGNGTSVSVGGQGQRVTSLSDGSLQFQASGSAGSVVVTVSYPVLLGSQTVSSNTDHLFLITPVAGGATATPGPGGGFTVSGSGFTIGGYMRSITASACGQALGVGSISNTSVALTAPGGYCNGGITLGVTAYATTAKSASVLTNTVGLGAGALNVQPNVGGLSAGSAAPGQTVSLSGAGFGTSGSATLNGAAVPSTWSDGGVSLTVQPQSTSGPVVFTRADGHQIAAGSLTVVSQIAGASPSRAQAGQSVTVSGAGFGPGGAVTLGSTGLPVTRWTPTQIVVTVPGGASGGDLTVMPQGNASSTLPNGIAVMRIDGVSPGAAAPGATVGISGAGFGQQKGSVTVAGVPASVGLWGDSTIAVTIPSIPALASGGDTQVAVSVPGAAGPLTVAFHVDPVSASTPGATPGHTPGSTSTPWSSATAGNTPSSTPSFIPPSSNGPLIQPGPVPFRTAPKLPGPVQLTLSSSRSSSAPGQDVPFTVTLTAFGKPVVGAPVDLLLVVVPGGDASVSPAKGVTDANGRVSGVLHLSRRAGDHIILARSGQYSDEIKVSSLGVASTGGSAAAGAGLGGPGGEAPRTVIVAALIGCLVLFLSGFGINVFTAGHPAAPAATAGPRRSALARLAAVPANVGAVAQFGAAMMVCCAGQLVAVARRR
jgi:IPT/TIG domain